ncbi:hypothetical protein ACI8AC_22765 [Geodermatophilus sp. SYSU D00758]
MGTSTARRIRRRVRMRSASLPPFDSDLPGDPAAEVAVRVVTAALAEHPGSAVDRVEVDDDGLYTVHLLTAFGQQVVVPVDRDLTVRGWVALAR